MRETFRQQVCFITIERSEWHFHSLLQACLWCLCSQLLLYITTHLSGTKRASTHSFMSLRILPNLFCEMRPFPACGRSPSDPCQGNSPIRKTMYLSLEYSRSTPLKESMNLVTVKTDNILFGGSLCLPSLTDTCEIPPFSENDFWNTIIGSVFTAVRTVDYNKLKFSIHQLPWVTDAPKENSLFSLVGFILQ